MLNQGFKLDRGVSKEETQRAHVSVHELKKNMEKEIERLREDVKGLKQVVNVSKEVDKIPFEESTGFLASLKANQIETTSKTV